MRLHVSLALVVLLVAGVGVAQEWPQWALNAQHSTQASVAGQNLNQNLVNIVYDPIVNQEMAGGEAVFGEAALYIHYQAPLVDGNDTYMMFKQGPFDINSYATQTWGETKYTWSGSNLNVAAVHQHHMAAIGATPHDHQRGAGRETLAV